ncbi:glycosyltransferase family 9 protein [Xenorhabdus bovienii]|uniref:Glycosyltransferase family 9 protein n=1 Tax=Xenorhabdus bovienii TaxID=40576 RepID=A0AAJ1JAY8_XENBV|nr:glycosyltransferase family 9 protein [Xenorhabdus bovienii]MDE1478518.1 glycosyltransferase family 9 protein [Xenorhabdus bovienii]MDE1485034.1 glycosyltransferase family 9 protein [Xenorhabdus bovienii]MDE1489898.1 glycosyltransferase family 9 protein [Xenorhabdus bovienii]MDE1493781.1 glycosyltransferase family 9 protein [Xenorhabdus bovienii]MDE9471769.1 glycosyltransferase family 9 protein [Xenorhabdus bovienii]
MTEKKFKKLREINRNKNYFFKKLRFNLAKIFIDKWSKKQFHLGDINKILFLRDDNKIGDMIVSTPVLRELSLNGFKLHVLSGPSNYCVIENNPYIDKVYFYPGKNIDILNLGLKLKQEKYDLVIDMGDQIPVIYLLFIRLINAKNTIGFNKDDINIYNKSIKYLNYHSHITERYKSLMNNIGIDNYNMQYDIHIPQVIKDKVCDFYTGLSGNITVVINPFTADEKRDLSKEQLIGIMSHLNCLDQSINIILVGQLEKLNALSYLSGCVVNPFGDFLSAVEIIKHADLVISPDTSIVHVAAAYEKNTVALYGNDKHGCFINNDVWGPGNKNAVQLVQNKNNSKISEIPLDIIVEKIDDFFNTLAKKI